MIKLNQLLEMYKEIVTFQNTRDHVKIKGEDKKNYKHTWFFITRESEILYLSSILKW